MADDQTVEDRQTKLLPLIAAFKILKALSLFVLALGLRRLRLGNSDAIILDWCRDIRIDPDNRIAHSIISKMTGLPAARLHELSVGTFFYGFLFATEGTGLLLKQRWAEYLTIVSTITFLPLEIYELVARPHRKILKAVLLLANLAIVVYLMMNVRKKKVSNVSGDFAS